jgi:hypothetical protein
MVFEVLHQCALNKDLDLFEAGDNTEVGEKGITLRFAFNNYISHANSF